MMQSLRRTFVDACLADDARARDWCGALHEVCRDVVAPGAAARDREARYPAEALAALREVGVFGLTIPEELGGIGMTPGVATLAIEELAAACPSVAAIVMFHLQVARRTLYSGSRRHLQDHLPRLASGEWLGASAWSESGSGSQKSAPRARMTPSPDGTWRISGEKVWCTGLRGAALFHVLVSGPVPEGRPPATFVAVSGSAHGVSIEPRDMLGLRASSTGTLRLDEVAISSDDVIGAPGSGMALMQENHRTCIHPGAIALGIARSVFELTVGIASGAVHGSSDITGHQNTRFQLADSELDLLSAYAVAGHAVRLVAGDAPDLPSESMKFKIVASAAARRIADRAMLLGGAKGFDRDAPLERWFREAQATGLMGPTAEIIRERMAEQLLRTYAESNKSNERRDPLADAGKA
ncbi:MAG TPA: acyl-CoA dehydrogenase family protein [Kofleriaceae bacterium]|jgi:hypothetical protein|nr:acyl-CoA dehydrogenase family protein [Kofleriaceae bacterium]